MTGRRHSRLRAFAWWLVLMAGLIVLGAAEALVRHGLVVAVLIVFLPPAAFAAGRQLGRRGARTDREAARELARLRAAVDELEDAAGRPLTVIIASYRHVGRRYGPEVR